MSILGMTDAIRRVVIFGSSGFCVQIGLDARYQAADSVEFAGYVDDVAEAHRTVEGYPIFSFDDLVAMGDVGVIVAVGDLHGRRSIYDRLHAHEVPILGLRGMPHLSHPMAHVGEGVVLASHTRVGHNSSIGRGTLATGDTIAHDVVIGEFTTLGPHSVVMGHVTIGDGVFVGGRALILNGTSSHRITIGEGAVIGAGAVIDRDVASGDVVVGPRAMTIKEWGALRALAKERQQ